MNKSLALFSVLGTIMTVLFFYIVNTLYTPHYSWFVYPAFCILWWPISYYYNSQRRYKEFSVIGCFMILSFLLFVNVTTSGSCPWFVYAAFPVVWWPITIFSGRKAGTLGYSLIVSLCTILYYAAANNLLSPAYPWFIYPTFAVLWWPLTLYFANRRQFIPYSFAASLHVAIFFIIVNLVSTPAVLWCIYPIFAVLWWPLAAYFCTRKAFLRFSLWGTFLTIFFFTIVNLLTTPHIIWAVYPTFCILWWPMAMLFRQGRSIQK